MTELTYQVIEEIDVAAGDFDPKGPVCCSVTSIRILLKARNSVELPFQKQGMYTCMSRSKCEMPASIAMRDTHLTECAAGPA